MTTTSADVQTWIDKSQLAELVGRLSSAIDRGEHDVIVACYAADSWDDHGGFKGSGREFAHYICAPSPMRDADAHLHHLIGQSLFEIDEDEAWGETFFVFHLTSDTKLYPGIGRYIDYFQRIDGEWKIKYRRVVSDWVGEVDARISATMPSYVQAVRGRADPVFDRRRWHE